jgi:hypothetical protein
MQPKAKAGLCGVLTIAFTACFAVWTIFAIIGIRIQQELDLNETQFGLLGDRVRLDRQGLLRVKSTHYRSATTTALLFFLLNLAASWCRTAPSSPLVLLAAPLHDE